MAFFLCWAGSATVYMASEKQLIMKNRLPKKMAWSFFIFCLSFSLFILTFIHDWLAAFLILLVLIMTIWISLALSIPYFPNQCKSLVVGTLLTCITAIVGGFYVV